MRSLLRIRWARIRWNWLLAVAALALVGCERDSDPAAEEQKTQQSFEWRMVTSWPPGSPGLGTAATEMAENIRVMSGGRLKVRVYGAGEVVPGLEVFDTVAGGSVQMGHSAAYYWRGKTPAAQFFTAVPFGLTANEQNAWLYHGGGLELWHKVYESFGLIAFPAGNTGPQWGGWFRNELKSAADLKGLIIRAPGMGGEVIARAGGQQVQLAGSEIFTALETGTVDAIEWINPFADMSMGFHQIAPYYYYPGWHEPGPTLELIINLEAWKSLPEDLQAIVRQAAKAANLDMHSYFDAHNPDALTELRTKHKIEVLPLPPSMLRQLKKMSREAIEDLAASDPLATEVYQSWKSFYDKIVPYRHYSEDYFVEIRAESESDADRRD